MTLALAVLQILTLLAVAALLLRRREAKEDPRIATLATDLARLDARLASVDEHLRSNVAQLRTDSSAEAQAGREAAERSAMALRTEVMSSVQSLGEAPVFGQNGARIERLVPCRRGVHGRRHRGDQNVLMV